MLSHINVIIILFAYLYKCYWYKLYYYTRWYYLYYIYINIIRVQARYLFLKEETIDSIRAQLNLRLTR